MGFGHFVDSVDKALHNVGRAGEFAIKHPDKVVSGALKVGEYAVEHPGQVANIAKKELVHSLTDPKELLINAALIAATGGAGIVAKGAAEIGTKTVAEVGAKTLAKTAEETTVKVAGETAAKAAGEAATKATAETAGKVGAETAGKAGVEAGGRTLEQKVLETGRHNPITRRINEFRSGAAQNFLARGGENPSALRQAGAAAIQGSTGTAPKQLEGMSDLAYKVQKTAWRGQQINKRVGQVQKTSDAISFAADPLGSTLKSGSDNTPVSQPGTEIEPYKRPGAMQPLSQPVSNSYTPGRGFSTPPPNQPPPNQPPGGSAYGGMGGSSNNPPSASTSGTTPSQSAAYRAGRGFAKVTGTTPGKAVGNYLNKPAVLNQGGLRAWQGPHREMFGGIDPNYDWRKGYENRPDKPFKPKLRKLGEEVKQETPGAYDTPSGQQPEGALNPAAPRMTELGTGVKGELGAGPPVHFGGPGPFKMGQPQAIGQGGRKASFYAASGEYTPQKGNIIDADSMSPDDYKFEPGGQGYLDFPDMPRAPLTQPKRGKQVLGV